VSILIAYQIELWGLERNNRNVRKPIFMRVPAHIAVLARVGESRWRRIPHSNIKNSVANRYIATQIPLGLLELCRPSCDNLVTIIDGNRPKSAGMDALSGGCNS
jgi:hypothetical protein